MKPTPTKNGFRIFGKSFETYAEALEYRDQQYTNVENRIGRRLTQAERDRGALDRPDDRDAMTRFNQDKFTPVLRQKSTFDRYYEDAQAELAKEQFNRMSDAEQRVHRMNEMLARKAGADEAEKRRQDYLDSPVVKKATAELDRIEQEIAWNPNRSLQELKAVRNAREQWSDPDSDHAVSRAMMRDVMDAQDAFVQKRDAATREKIKAMELTLAVEKAPVDRIGVNFGEAIEKQGHDLFMGLSGKDAPFELLDHVHSALNAMREGNEAPIREAIAEYGWDTSAGVAPRTDTSGLAGAADSFEGGSANE